MQDGQNKTEPFRVKGCALIQIAAGARARNVRENLLITRRLREDLTLMPGLTRGAGDRLEPA
jgi:hypothetical protein